MEIKPEVLVFTRELAARFGDDNVAFSEYICSSNPSDAASRWTIPRACSIGAGALAVGIGASITPALSQSAYAEPIHTNLQHMQTRAFEGTSGPAHAVSRTSERITPISQPFSMVALAAERPVTRLVDTTPLLSIGALHNPQTVADIVSPTLVLRSTQEIIPSASLPTPSTAFGTEFTTAPTFAHMDRSAQPFIDTITMPVAMAPLYEKIPLATAIPRQAIPETTKASENNQLQAPVTPVTTVVIDTKQYVPPVIETSTATTSVKLTPVSFDGAPFPTISSMVIPASADRILTDAFKPFITEAALPSMATFPATHSSDSLQNHDISSTDNPAQPPVRSETANLLSASEKRKQVVKVLEDQEAQKVHETGGNNSGLPAERYANGRKEAWCDDFATWVDKEAKLPLAGTPSQGVIDNVIPWTVKAVELFKQMGQDPTSGVHVYTAADIVKGVYVPRPGDYIYLKHNRKNKNEVDHVQRVISSDGKGAVTIGGNQSGGPNGSDRVSRETTSLHDPALRYVIDRFGNDSIPEPAKPPVITTPEAPPLVTPPPVPQESSVVSAGLFTSAPPITAAQTFEGIPVEDNTLLVPPIFQISGIDADPADSIDPMVTPPPVDTPPTVTVPTSDLPPVAAVVTPAVVQAMIPGISDDNLAVCYPRILKALAERGIATEAMTEFTFATERVEVGASCSPREENGHAGGKFGQYYGRGDIQLTTENNYRAAGSALGLDLVNHPELALEPTNSARILAWFLSSSGRSERIKTALDNGDMTAARIVVNGKKANGLPNGLTDFKASMAAGMAAIQAAGGTKT